MATWITMQPARVLTKTRDQLKQFAEEISAASGRKIKWHEARKIMRDEKKGALNFMNDRYHCQLKFYNTEAGRIAHLSIKRHDREPIHDWRDLQRIKNDILGPECEAVELYPAESRLMDTSNQYHLWGSDDPTFRFPVGYTCERTVSYKSGKQFKQRGNDQ